MEVREIRNVVCLFVFRCYVDVFSQIGYKFHSLSLCVPNYGGFSLARRGKGVVGTLKA